MVDECVIGIHDGGNGSGYYIIANGNPKFNISEVELDYGSYSLGDVFGTGDWKY